MKYAEESIVLYYFISAWFLCEQVADKFNSNFLCLQVVTACSITEGNDLLNIEFRYLGWMVITNLG